MDGICLIGTQGKQPATKTMRQDSLFTGKLAEFGMRHGIRVACFCARPLVV